MTKRRFKRNVKMLQCSDKSKTIKLKITSRKLQLK